MRAARAGFLLTISVGLACVIAGAAPAATPAPPSFAVTVSPEYTTAGQTTTFHVTVMNLSSPGTMLGSFKLQPPAGFAPPQPKPGSPMRSKTSVHGRALSLTPVALQSGETSKPVIFTESAPTKCGRTSLQWSAQAFEGTTDTTSQLALQTALSKVGVTVLCVHHKTCGAVQPCKTGQRTSSGTYDVASSATAGMLRVTVNVGNQLSCGKYQFRDPNWYASLVAAPTSSPPTAAPAAITDTVTYTVVNATRKGIGFCLGAAYQFTTASGGQAPAGALPNGDPGFIGLLPRCSKGKPPCIASVKQTTDASTTVGSDVTMKVLVPENGDPWGHS